MGSICRHRIVLATGALLVLTACADRRGGSVDGGDRGDAPDSATDDAGGRRDVGTGADAGLDASGLDGGGRDGGNDGSGLDSGRTDSMADSGIVDATAMDATVDSTVVDSAPPLGGCVSGAAGTHVVRFRWNGTTSGSRATVGYEANTLPDTSRWRVSAASSSIGYTSVFRDPFLGAGGLDLSGTVFIDVELSTDGLRPVRNATIAIYGRSFNTTASGSFTWQTFSGTGASSRGGVSSVAPYQWYSADATAALPAGDRGTLLRIRAGPPSNSLIVNRVEVCFDAP